MCTRYDSRSRCQNDLFSRSSVWARGHHCPDPLISEDLSAGRWNFVPNKNSRDPNEQLLATRSAPHHIHNVHHAYRTVYLFCFLHVKKKDFRYILAWVLGRLKTRSIFSDPFFLRKSIHSTCTIQLVLAHKRTEKIIKEQENTRALSYLPGLIFLFSLRIQTLPTRLPSTFPPTPLFIIN